jgi:glycogen debranching enzyme
MSYHNGSVWPHDTALIALGMRRIGRNEDAIRLVTGLIEAGFRFSDGRLPELFCGFERDQRFNSSPAAYIVSCSPQAWAAGCVFQLLQCILDIRPDVHAQALQVDPVLPPLIGRIDVDGLRVGDRSFRLRVESNGDRPSVDVTEVTERRTYAGAAG